MREVKLVSLICVKPTSRRWAWHKIPTNHETLSMVCHVGSHDDFSFTIISFGTSGLHLLVWSELGQSQSFWPKRDLRTQWATSHTRLRARDQYTSSTHTGGKAEPVQVRFTPRLRDQQSKWMQDGCEVYINSYMASNRSCFMVTWTIFQNHLLEVGLTQNQKTTTLRPLTTIALFHFILYDNLHESKLVSKHLAEGPITYDFTLHLRTRDHTTWFSKSSWDGLGTLPFGLSQCPGRVKWPLRREFLGSPTAKSL